MKLASYLYVLLLGFGAAHVAQGQSAPNSPAPNSRLPDNAAPGRLSLELSNPGITGRVKALDNVVALVNSEVILRSELSQQLARVEKQLAQQNISLPPRAVLEKQVLERLVLDKLQVQLARTQGMRVDDTTLERTIERIAEQNSLSLPQFRERLAKEGVAFASFREDIRNEILISRIREREIEQRLQITEAEVDDYVRQQQNADLSVPINLGQIVLRVPENASQALIAEKRQRAEQLLAQLKQGAEFARVAAASSEGFDATRGGEMGLRPLGRYPQVFIDAVRNLKTGEISGVVQSPAGFHLLRVIERKGAVAPALPGQVEQTHARHILLRTSDGLTDEEAQRRLNDYKQRIENKAATFEELAKRFSRDGSAAQGGDLGWVYPGDTVPEFERAMNALALEQISVPIQTPFGWHLIQVLKRKTAEVASDRKRLVARQALRERKAEEVTQEWLGELRDNAYVEFRLDS